jgi:acyl-CoA thioester hydrolase
MKEHEFNVRVRYAETDQMGWFIMVMLSILRWDAWNGLETWDFIQMDGRNGIMLPVVSLNINYKNQPVMMTLTGKTIFKSQTVKIEFDYEIYNEQASC